jgi:hypothetical protein
VSWEDFPVRLARSLLGDTPTDEDALSVLLLLHTHRFWFNRSWPDRPDIREMAADTQRGCASVVADAWPNRGDAERTAYMYWYRRFNIETPYECIDDVPEPWRSRVEQFRERSWQHPDVERVEPQD